MIMRADEKALVMVFPCGGRPGRFLVDLVTEDSAGILHSTNSAAEAMALGAAEAKARGLRLDTSGMSAPPSRTRLKLVK